MDTFFSVGLKIVAALGIGAAVYLGLDSLKDKKQEAPKPQQPEPDDSSSNTQQQPPQQRSIEIIKPETRGDKVVGGLKTAQEVCGRAFTLCQNLVLVAENLRSVFSPQGQYQNQPGSVGQGGYGYRDPYNNGYQDKYKDPPGFRRISPFILEWVGVSNTQQPPQQNNGPWGY